MIFFIEFCYLQTFIGPCVRKCPSPFKMSIKNEQKTEKSYFLILSIQNTSKSIQRLKRRRCKPFQIKILFSFFFIFNQFLTIFNCVSHSTSRHTDFSWTFWDRHSTSFLSNFSGNGFSCPCQLSAGDKPSTMVTAAKTCKAGHFEKGLICE